MGASKRTIVLKGVLSQYREEKPANAALSPGHFVELMSTGKVRKNTIVAGVIPLAIACEDSLQGKTIADAYAADAPVQIHIPRPGDILNCRLPAAAAAIVVGDRIEMVTAGVVQKLASGVAIGLAEEAVDNSAGGAEVFIAVKIL